MNNYYDATKHIHRAVKEIGARAVIEIAKATVPGKKFCPYCKQNLPESAFYWRSDGYLSGYCMQCTKERQRKFNALSKVKRGNKK